MSENVVFSSSTKNKVAGNEFQFEFISGSDKVILITANNYSDYKLIYNDIIYNIVIDVTSFSLVTQVIDYSTGITLYKRGDSPQYYVEFHTINPYERTGELLLTTEQQGGKHTYKGRTYKLRTGQRGGKYILVGGSKVYVNKKNT